MHTHTWTVLWTGLVPEYRYGANGREEVHERVQVVRSCVCGEVESVVPSYGRTPEQQARHDEMEAKTERERARTREYNRKRKEAQAA